MKGEKKAQLESAGWKIGSADEFLGLTPDESEYLDLRMRLSEAVKKRRQEQKLTQVELAARMGSSQSRMAKAEAADRSVSLDLLIRYLFALGASRQDLAEAIAG